ncbi:hypothetical protein THIOM_004820 [Candidatus Thiomargarita nelsonii]|uniref:Uncharacterized protein n=1 Tax=Candidatus Thiomargarita nelsonii TaxID=1003181 RepID=A0A176RUV6_9GAMM|nr:hypothetical protein THIOM_004820 [Candidatus Thiomargarita nelsonii]
MMNLSNLNYQYQWQASRHHHFLFPHQKYSLLRNCHLRVLDYLPPEFVSRHPFRYPKCWPQ